VPLTPNDIQQKTFRVALRGYAEDEVDEFLDEVVVAIREYQQQLEEVQFQVNALQGQVSESRQTEDAMRRTLLLAERTADEITEEARRDAERILSDARAEATQLTADQGREKNQLLGELHRLRDLVGDVQRRLADVAGDVETRVAPITADLDEALATTEPYEAPPEPVAPPIERWQEPVADEPVADTSPDDEERDSGYWGAAGDDVGADQLPEDGAGQEEAVGSHWESTVAETASDVSDDLVDGTADEEGISRAGEEPQTAADEFDVDALDHLEDPSQSSRRPWERYGD
jgi:cell division initiation protein